MIKPRSAVTTLSFVPHGAITPAELARLGLHRQDVVDFSVSVNPYGPAPAVIQALTAVNLARYPDPNSDALRQALAVQHHLSVEHILVGNGATELLWLVALAFLEPGDAALVLGPTFGEYARVGRMMGARIITWQAHTQRTFAIETDLVATYLNRYHPRLVFACHPNNPTGQLLPLKALATWAAACPETLFVVDEAYLLFAPAARSAQTMAAPNVLTIHSMTKAQALAGLRLGYALGPKSIIAALKRVQPPWSVNAMAQAAGLAALQHRSYQRRTLEQLVHHKATLVQALQGAGWQPVPSATHFFLLPVANAAHCRTRLLRHGVVVRDASSFGLPRHIRIAARMPHENERLLAALTAVHPRKKRPNALE